MPAALHRRPVGRRPRRSGRARSSARPTAGSVATVAEAGRADTEAAIAAARRAFDEGPWPRTPERRARRAAAAHRRPAGARQRRSSPAPSRWTPASGWSRASTTSTTSSPASATTAASPAADAGRVIDTGRDDAVSRVVYEPVGVCGLITPWNYPLLQASWKVAPALAGRQHVRAQAERADPVHRHPADAGAGGGRAAGRRRQPRARRRARGRARRCPRTPTSTWSPSPAGWRPAGGSWPRPPAR